MMRRPRRENWVQAMRGIIAARRGQPFAWGTCDCTMFADVVEAMTGFDPLSDCRGYASELGAIRALTRAGFTSVAQLVEDRFEEIPPLQAMRGDLGYPAEFGPLMSPAVIDGNAAIGFGLYGLIHVPRAVITRAFAV